MTKHDLANTVAENARIDHDLAGKAIDSLIEVIADGLKHEGDIRIHGLGHFKAVDRPARKARNPRTGEPVDVPAKRVVRFTAAKGFGVSA